MHHSTIDRFASRSPFGILDPRLKVVATIVLVTTVALLTELHVLTVALAFVIGVGILSGIPGHHLLARFLLTLPFILFASLSQMYVRGMDGALIMTLRMTTCILALLILSTTTPFFDLLSGLGRLGMPRVILVLLLFLYRYSFVFVEELHRMEQGRRARGYVTGRHLLDRRGMGVISGTIGLLLVRAYERGLRIYDALVLRGYDGNIRPRNRYSPGMLDTTFTASMVSMCVMFLVVQWGVVG